MSAQNSFMTAIKASERGAYDYLPKPFDLRELVSIGRAIDISGNYLKKIGDRRLNLMLQKNRL